MTGKLLRICIAMVASLSLGCQSYQLDYGKPVAQFLEQDVATKGAPFIGKKITIQGTVTRVDVETAGSAAIELQYGIRCELGKFKEMAESRKPGDTIFVDGFLKRCKEDDVLLEPAMLRDQKAPFSRQR